MTKQPNWHMFETAGALAQRFAEDTAAQLKVAISKRGRALLAVSGGTTPAAYFRALSARDIQWSAVTIVPVDERFVPTTSDRSNERLIRQNLLINKAAAAGFVPLYHPVAQPEEAADLAESAVKDLPLPFDIAVLGMGSDGHTASFFPDSPQLAEVIDPAAARHVAAVSAPSADEPRLTLTLPLLLSAGLIALHIEGVEKRALLRAVIEQPVPSQKPIGAVLAHASRPLEIYWSPKEGEQP